MPAQPRSWRFAGRVMPLVDLAFLLTVSSILIARIGGSAGNSPVRLAGSQQAVIVRDDRLSVSVVGGTKGMAIAVGPKDFSLNGAGMEAAATEIANQLARSSSTSVDLRASGALSYEQVEPALRAIAQASQALGSPVELRVFRLDDDGSDNE